VNADDTQVTVTNTSDGSVIPVALDALPRVLEDGELWVPANFFETAYGYNADLSAQTITIHNPNA